MLRHFYKVVITDDAFLPIVQMNTVRPRPHGLKHGRPIICFKIVSFLSAFVGIWELEISNRKGLPKEAKICRWAFLLTDLFKERN